jgi:pyrimidine operon attenuation protein / uracil phosphoribosyltransferase
MTEAPPPGGQQILNETALAAALDRMAAAIAAGFAGTADLVLVGVKRRGDLLACRLSKALSGRIGYDVPVGSLDITLYRDDFESLSEQPIVGQTAIDFPIARRTVVLVDDVLFTGRTVRAALDELADLGRPARVILAVLVDRGGREVPITPDIVGLTLSSDERRQVQVMLRELDGCDAVVVHAAEPPA